MNYVGADVHISSIDFAVVNETGRVVKRERIETSERGMVEFMRTVREPRQLIIEEGSLSGWIKDVMENRGERVVITDPKRNKWIGFAESKDDRIDAEKLAQLHRGGYTKEIVHLTGNRRRFRELMMYYHDTVKSVVRAKNKLKAKYRQSGIQCRGATVYDERHFSAWLEKLPGEEAVRFQAKGLMAQVVFLEGQRDEALARVKEMGRGAEEIAQFRRIAGIDWVVACTISALVGDMRRFSNKRKFWKYAGLGLVRRKSGNSASPVHLTGDYNRKLKWAFKTAARCAIASSDNPFRRQYLRLTIECGIMEHRALLTVARGIASTVYAMWKKGAAYDPSVREKSAA